ncbi:FeoB-associated Cys-rich membrane protein [Desulfosediminicola flagellatus]|uniref:FeoB-associated Cys-rich membrane protein n=1 Tax=Desulfosediminicola flagellatus TaxID=2569541 RepID=UPI0010AC37D2
MWENIILWSILGCCAFFVGRRFFRQMRTALDPKANATCDCSCSGCGTSNCNDRK